MNVVNEGNAVIIRLSFFLNIDGTAFLLNISLEEDAIDDPIKGREIVG